MMWFGIINVWCYIICSTLVDGILKSCHSTSCVHTPHQNGLKHRDFFRIIKLKHLPSCSGSITVSTVCCCALCFLEYRQFYITIHHSMFDFKRQSLLRSKLLTKLCSLFLYTQNILYTLSLKWLLKDTLPVQCTFPYPLILKKQRRPIYFSTF